MFGAAVLTVWAIGRLGRPGDHMDTTRGWVGETVTVLVVGVVASGLLGVALSAAVEP
jgi:hypothetical protein